MIQKNPMDSLKAREAASDEGKPIKTNLLEFSANKAKREEFEKEKLALKESEEKKIKPLSFKLNLNLSGSQNN